MPTDTLPSSPPFPSRAIPEGTGVLLIGHGSVDRVEEIPAFVRAIRRGRPTDPAIIDEVIHRWVTIGGSPLARIVEAQARALEARLGIPVAAAARLCAPYARDVVPALAARGVHSIVSLPLAPYSVPIYNAVVREACIAAGVAAIDATPWGREPALIDAFADVTRERLEGLDAPHVVFSAHSLPLAVIRAGDPYDNDVRATAAAVQRALGFDEARTHVAYQSAGADGGEWLRPDLPAVFRAIIAAGGRDVVVCAIGFLAEHTETLYDLDIEARALAEGLGLRFHRVPALDVHPRLLDAFEAVVRAALG
jgi:protoporphyrin/coproporphyrin ferrochelatase